MGFVTSDRWLYSSGADGLHEQLGASLSIGHLERLDAKTAFYQPKQRPTNTAPRVHPVAIVLGLHKDGQALTRAAIYSGADSARYAGLKTLQYVAGCTCLRS